MSIETRGEAAQAPAGVTPSGGAGRGFLSDVIVELGFATRDAVEEAVRAARSPGTTVARALVDSGAISEEQLARATAERYGFDYIDLEGFDVDPAAANLIKPTVARRYLAVPVCFLGQTLLVAMADPADSLGVNDIAVMTKLEVRPAVAARPALGELLEALPLDEAEAGAAVARPAPASVPEVAEKPESSAVFWQDGAGGELKAPEAAGPPDEELRARVAELEAELERAAADEELRAGELATLRERLTAAENELSSARAEAEKAVSRAEAAESRAAAAEARDEELRDADARAEQARQALIAGREKAERELEQSAITERDLRDQLSDVETRRAELEERMREALRALAGPEGSDPS